MSFRRALTGTLALAISALAFGFILFASIVTRDAEPANTRADAIVVLTGGEARLLEAARLLRDQKGKRLLISGVNRKTPPDDIRKRSGITAELFTCCVDLGYDALDTFGNADETRQWMREKGFRSLIVVTSSYHMPRSLAELSLALPDVTLVPHPVTPKSFPEAAWWLYPKTMRILVSEYLKFLPVAARASLARVIGAQNISSIADKSATPRTPG